METRTDKRAFSYSTNRRINFDGKRKYYNAEETQPRKKPWVLSICQKHLYSKEYIEVRVFQVPRITCIYELVYMYIIRMNINIYMICISIDRNRKWIPFYRPVFFFFAQYLFFYFFFSIYIKRAVFLFFMQ